jgi:predicted phosphodiesterase
MKRTHQFWAVNLLLLGMLAVFGLRAVQEPKNNFRFAILGDRTGGAQPQIYGRVWREVDLFHPDFVINVGDTIQGRQDESALAQWTELRPIWARYSHYPLYFTPGNHDVWSDFSRDLYEQESKRKAFYSFNYEDSHFTVLDTSITRELTDEQLQFLEQDLKTHQERDPKFVFFHHPSWIRQIDEGQDFKLHQLAKTYGVDYVVSGHGHVFVKRVHEGIVYMEVGSSGGQMTAPLVRGEGFRDGRFYHWVWGDVKGSKVSLSVKEIDGQMGAGRMFRIEDWDENGPKFDVSDPALTDKPET